MARLSDHDIRDAEDALRSELGLVVKRYIRRMNEMGTAHIQESYRTSDQGKEDQSMELPSAGKLRSEPRLITSGGLFAGVTTAHYRR